MFEKHENYFENVFKASDLRLPKPKPKPPPPPNVSVTIVKRDNKSELENNFDKVLGQLLADGEKEKAYMLQQVFQNSRDFSIDLINKINGKDKSNEMSVADGTALLLRLDLTKNQYQVIKNESDKRKSHFLPNYKDIQDEKQECLPDNIQIEEDCAQVPLKDLMIKTFQRHMLEKTFKKMIYQLTTKNGGKKLKLHMYYKSGYDCASGQSKFKVSTIKIIVLKSYPHFAMHMLLQLVSSIFGG